jgi:hypothetical protein
MRKAHRNVGVVVLLITGMVLGTLPQAHAMTTDFAATPGCTGWTNGTGSLTSDRDNTGSNAEHIIFEAFDGAGTRIFSASFTLPVSFTGTIASSWPWDSAPSYNPITLQVRSPGYQALPKQIHVAGVGNCAGLPTYKTAGPGPDMVPIPATAVVGSFVSTTPVYFEPRLDAASDVVMEAGKTAWVYGVDASGAFYQVMLSGQFFWVPVSSMGPNYDDVWQGRPLPGGRVDSDSSGSEQSSPSMGSTVPMSFPVYGAPVDAETYTVQAGDNLFRIALHFGVDLYRLAAVNGIQDPNHILVGQVLDIAAAR